jgi:hypothetical protein
MDVYANHLKITFFRSYTVLLRFIARISSVLNSRKKNLLVAEREHSSIAAI